MPNIILLGPPGAGKGTQAKEIKFYYKNMPHISTGDIFRQAYADRTELGIEAYEKYWCPEIGKLVPDDVTNALAFERLQKRDCQKGFILDGYPRTVPQAQALQVFLNTMGRSIDHVLYIKADEATCTKRILTRLTCQECGAIYGADVLPTRGGICNFDQGELVRRTDDNETTVRKRFVEYQEKTAPLLEFYRERMKEINGQLSVPEVTAAIREILGER